MSARFSDPNLAPVSLVLTDGTRTVEAWLPSAWQALRAYRFLKRGGDVRGCSVALLRATPYRGGILVLDLRLVAPPPLAPTITAGGGGGGGGSSSGEATTSRP